MSWLVEEEEKVLILGHDKVKYICSYFSPSPSSLSPSLLLIGICTRIPCRKDNVEIATRLLEAGADGRKPDGGGNTPLHAAAGAGAMKVVQYLAGEGLSIDALNAQGLTPLVSSQRLCH